MRPLAIAAASALAVHLGGSLGLAQQPAGEPAVDAAPSTLVEERIDLNRLVDLLGEIGIEERSLFEGGVVSAHIGAEPVVLLIGLDHSARDQATTFEPEDFEAVRGDLEAAGFADVQQEPDWPVVQGTLEGHSILAAAGTPGWAAAEPASPDSGAGEAAREMEATEFEPAAQFEAMLVRARAAEGRSILILIGPAGFEPSTPVGLTQEEMEARLADAGLRDMDVLDEDVFLLRGDFNGRPVLALGGSGLREAPVATGTVPPAPEADIPHTAPAATAPGVPEGD